MDSEGKKGVNPAGGNVGQDDMKKFEEFLETTKLLKNTDLNDRFIEFLIEVNLHGSEVYEEFKVFKRNPKDTNERPGISFEAACDYANKNMKSILEHAPKILLGGECFVERLLDKFVKLCKDQLAIKTQMKANIATLQGNFGESDTKKEDNIKTESATNKTMLEAIDKRDITFSSAIEVFQSNVESKGIVVEGQVNLQCSLAAMCFVISDLVDIIKRLIAEEMELKKEKERLQKELFAKVEENIIIKAELKISEGELASQQEENKNKQKLIETQQKVCGQQIKMLEFQIKQVEEREKKVKELQELFEKQKKENEKHQAEIKKQLEDIEKWKLANKTLVQRNSKVFKKTDVSPKSIL